MRGGPVVAGQAEVWIGQLGRPPALLDRDRLLLSREDLQEEQEDVQDVEEDRRGQQGAELMSRERRIRWKSSMVKLAKMTRPSTE